jgi:PAS domain S-box-containing protein
VHLADVERLRRLLDDDIAGAAPAFDGEWRVRHGDGSHRWVRVRGLCVRDDGGRPLRLAGSVSDIDPHKRAQASLQQAQRPEAVGTLASGVAHDFNNIHDRR